jgi:mannose-6-phosphate isomerase-like protein (cupin superfamily)
MISPYRPATESWIAEGCFIIELHNRPEDEGCSIARARVPAGGVTRLHSLHGTIERYVILAGTARLRTGEDSGIDLGPLDTVTFGAGEPQAIANTGEGDLVFLAICTPRFRPESYRDLEVGAPHVAMQQKSP